MKRRALFKRRMQGGVEAVLLCGKEGGGGGESNIFRLATLQKEDPSLDTFAISCIAYCTGCYLVNAKPTVSMFARVSRPKFHGIGFLARK